MIGACRTTRCLRPVALLVFVVALASCITPNDDPRDLMISPTPESPSTWEFESIQGGREFFVETPTVHIAVGQRAWLLSPGRPTGCGTGEEFGVYDEPVVGRLVHTFEEEEVLAAGDYKLLVVYRPLDRDTSDAGPVREERWFSLLGLSGDESRMLHSILLDDQARRSCPETWREGFYSLALKTHANHWRNLLFAWLEGSVLTREEKLWLLRLRADVALTLWLEDEASRYLLQLSDQEIPRKGEWAARMEEDPEVLWGFGVWPSAVPDFEQDAFANAFSDLDPVFCRAFAASIAPYTRKPLTMKYW